MMLFGVESSDKSAIRGSNLRRAQITSRYLNTESRALEDEDDDEDGNSDMNEDEEEDEEEGEDADENDADEDSDSDEGGEPTDSGKNSSTLFTSAPGDGPNNQMEGENKNDRKDPAANPVTQQINQTAPSNSPLANVTGGGSMGFPLSSQPGQSVVPSTPQQGAGLVPPANSTSHSGGSQGGSPPKDTNGVPPVDSASSSVQKEQPAAPVGGGVPINPNTPPNQFGDTPFLGQGGNDWNTTTPPIGGGTTTTPPMGDMGNLITPIEPTDEEPRYAPPPLDNFGGQGGIVNQPGFPADGNNMASSSYSPPPPQGGGFNPQYGGNGSSQFGNSQLGNGGGQAPKKEGGLAGAWKSLKNKSAEKGKSSVGEDIKEEEAMEEEELADEMEGGSDDDRITSATEQSGSKPADADDEFEKMIEEAEGETSKEKGTDKETEETAFEDLDIEEKEEVAEEELEEVEEELKEEEEVAAAAGGMGFLLAIGGMIFTAHQMSENPDGVYASVCRLAITISGVIVKIICMPCRKVIGTGNPHYATHMPVSTSADYGMGGANAGFEMS
ncbi:unnamed protein product [Cylindrotheca closterium]|uniref:Uncharacterized protein n=1 Tax=Cylindrotheca closterium TaxID=2856 RepID=A0AAD2JI68_9STRA|nr:unnamed protein product [Cylindrotheca closterium]